MAFDSEAFLEMLSVRNPIVVVASDGAISEVYYPGVKVEQNSDPAFILLDLDDPDSYGTLYYNEIVCFVVVRVRPTYSTYDKTNFILYLEV